MTNNTSIRADADDRGCSEAQKVAICEGAVLTVPHPFVWEKVSLPPDDPEGQMEREIMSWRPGTLTEYEHVHRNRPYDHEYGPEVLTLAHGIGAQILTVVSIHKPGRFPTRVFYTRRWRDPNGKEFGKGALRIKTVDAFRRLARGYRHEFDLATYAAVAVVATEEQGLASARENPK